jgi:SMI1/KNR4 family protein SUKH-1
VDLSELSELTVNMDLHPAATNTMIMAVEEHLGARLPKDYAQFFKLANGGEGFIGNAYAILWSVEELSSMNRSYELQKYAHGLLIFGSEGGGEAYGFDTRAPNLRATLAGGRIRAGLRNAAACGNCAAASG